LNLNVAIIMPPGTERDGLVRHVEEHGCAVQVADDVSQLLARGGDDGCSVGILDFGDALEGGGTGGAATNGAASGGAGGAVLDQGMRREAVRLLKQRSPRMQLALWLDRSAAAEGAEMNELGIRNIFLKPIRFEPIEILLKAAGKSAGQHAREQRETARVQEEFRFDRIVGKSLQIHESIELARNVARSGATSVLVLGESGVGEGAFRASHPRGEPAGAGSLHGDQLRRDPARLLERALRTREGRLHDATQLRVGLFEAAEHGSVFLDEVGELPLTLQAKLLKFLDSKIVRRVGGSRDIQVDVRILAATNRSLVDEVRQGRFRRTLLPPQRRADRDPAPPGTGRRRAPRDHVRRASGAEARKERAPDVSSRA
jgi:hypothetical protein